MKHMLLQLPLLNTAILSTLGAGAAAGAEPSAVKVETLTQIEAGTGGVCVAADGSIYVADFGAILGDTASAGTKLFKLGQDAKAEVFAEGFNGASGNTFDRHGNLYQSNIRGEYIAKVTPAGAVSTYAEEGLQLPVGVVVDAEGNLFVANCGGNSIQKVTPRGVSTRFVESPLLVCPNGITLDEENNVYVANFDNGDVIKVTPDGKASRLVTLPGNNNGHLTYFRGSLYVVARGVHQVYTVSLSGEATVFAGSGEKGGQDGDPLEASFCYPNGISATPDGRAFYVNEIADESTDGIKLSPTRVRRIILDSP